MIKICLKRDKEGFIREFSIKGHAGYAEHGKDIVCAGVSAIAYTTLAALKEIAGICNYTEKKGSIECSIPKDISQDAKIKGKIILDTMAIGFKQIEREYKDYVLVFDKEV
ncbi:MAG TPA: ribosomal-processing cysteine protease Prp [Clostridiaceae bacterium]|nr:ribosomal-processing cysteine protease Prp [Clostridiaceae bacterium]